MEYLHLRNNQLENINESPIDKATTIEVPVPGGAIKISFNDSTKTCGIVGWTGKPTTIILKSSYKKNSTGTPYKLTSISSRAFYLCQSLTSIQIPSTITLIGVGPFGVCESLISIVVDPANPKYKSISKLVLLTKDGTELIQYAAGNKNKSYTIPSTVTTIYDLAFDLCINLSSIIIEPNSKLTTIGNYAFAVCTSLTKITIPATVTLIGVGPFRECKSLTSIEVDPANPKYKSISKLVLLSKDGTELIQYPAGNKNKSYIIPATVTTIGDNAFDSCSNLSSITIEPNSKLITIGINAFSNCSSLTKITIPATVTDIGPSAFIFCDKLSIVTLYTKNIKISLDKVFLPTLSTLNLIGDYNNKLKNMFFPFKEYQQYYPDVKEKTITIYYNKANGNSFKSLDANAFFGVKYILKESSIVMKDIDLDVELDLVDENKSNTQSYLRTKLLLAKIVH